MEAMRELTRDGVKYIGYLERNRDRKPAELAGISRDACPTVFSSISRGISSHLAAPPDLNPISLKGVIGVAPPPPSWMLPLTRRRRDSAGMHGAWGGEKKGFFKTSHR